MIIAVPNCHLSSLFKKDAGLSGGPVIRKSACQCREHGFNPWPRKIPHAAGSN